MKNISIFTGHFGSGKTEIAINKALDLNSKGKKVAIVDLDIVNPYFCTREMKFELEEKGIRVITSNPEYVNAELMVVPSNVNAIFDDESIDEVIVDVGGDGEGAVVLGQYFKFFKDKNYKMYFVVNNNRPLTNDEDGIENFLINIEKASRLKVSELISNTNMSYETTEEDILKGDKIVKEISKKLNIPYKILVCKNELVPKIKNKIDVEVYGIDIFMKPPWR